MKKQKWMSAKIVALVIATGLFNSEAKTFAGDKPCLDIGALSQDIYRTGTNTEIKVTDVHGIDQLPQPDAAHMLNSWDSGSGSVYTALTPSTYMAGISQKDCKSVTFNSDSTDSINLKIISSSRDELTVKYGKGNDSTTFSFKQVGPQRLDVTQSFPVTCGSSDVDFGKSYSVTTTFTWNSSGQPENPQLSQNFINEVMETLRRSPQDQGVCAQSGKSDLLKPAVYDSGDDTGGGGSGTGHIIDPVSTGDTN